MMKQILIAFAFFCFMRTNVDAYTLDLGIWSATETDITVNSTVSGSGTNTWDATSTVTYAVTTVPANALEIVATAAYAVDAEQTLDFTPPTGTIAAGTKFSITGLSVTNTASTEVADATWQAPATLVVCSLPAAINANDVAASAHSITSVTINVGGSGVFDKVNVEAIKDGSGGALTPAITPPAQGDKAAAIAVNGLSAGTKYQLDLSAELSGCREPASVKSTDVTPYVICTAPNSVGGDVNNKKAAIFGSNSITLDATKVTIAGGYDGFKVTIADATQKKIASEVKVTKSEKMVITNKLIPNTLYTVKVYTYFTCSAGDDVSSIEYTFSEKTSSGTKPFIGGCLIVTLLAYLMA